METSEGRTFGQTTQVIGSGQENRGTVDDRRKMPKILLRSNEHAQENDTRYDVETIRINLNCARRNKTSSSASRMC